MKIDAVFHLRIQIFQNDVVDISSQVTDRCVQKPELILNADFFKICPGCGIKLSSLSPMGEIDGIHIMHQLQRLLFADMFVERSAEVVGNVVFAVTESACSAKSGHDRAALAAYAGLDPVPIDRTMPFLQLISALKYTDLPARLFQHKFISGKNTAGAGSYNYHVIHP